MGGGHTFGLLMQCSLMVEDFPKKQLREVIENDPNKSVQVSLLHVPRILSGNPALRHRHSLKCFEMQS